VSKKSRISHGTGTDQADQANVISENEDILMTDIEELEGESLIPASEGMADCSEIKVDMDSIKTHKAKI
jgi:hypothetical protein